MDKINIKRVLICFNDKKRTNKQTNLLVISFYLFKNPLMKEKKCNLKGKTLMIMILQKVKSYVCTFQGHKWKYNINLNVRFRFHFVANEFWADYNFLVYKISLKKLTLINKVKFIHLLNKCSTSNSPNSFDNLNSLYNFDSRTLSL